MAKRRTDKPTAYRNAPETARGDSEVRLRDGLDRFVRTSELVARARPLMLAARRLRKGLSMVRAVGGTDGATGGLPRVSGGRRNPVSPGSAMNERLRPALSAASALASGRQVALLLDGLAAGSGRVPDDGAANARAVGSPSAGADASNRAASPRESAPQRPRRTAGAKMADAVTRASGANRMLDGGPRPAPGATRRLYTLAERAHEAGASAPSAKRSGGVSQTVSAASRASLRPQGPAQTAGKANRSAYPAALYPDRLHRALSRFAGAVGVFARALDGAALDGGRERRGRETGAGTALASTARAGLGGAALGASSRMSMPSERFIAAPALAASEARQPAARPSATRPVVINSSPTVVINSADSGPALEQRLLDALAKHRDALYDQWQREREKRLRTEF